MYTLRPSKKGARRKKKGSGVADAETVRMAVTSPLPFRPEREREGEGEGDGGREEARRSGEKSQGSEPVLGSTLTASGGENFKDRAPPAVISGAGALQGEGLSKKEQGGPSEDRGEKSG
jgi:hypothetical protein